MVTSTHGTEQGSRRPWMAGGADRAPFEERHAMSLATDEIQPRTIVVGYDGSDEARAAFAVAIDRAEPTDTIVVVHATDPAWHWLGTPYYERAVGEIHDVAER